MEIKIENKTLDLPVGFSFDVEEYSPVFNDLGSQTIPATVPATPANHRALGFPDLIECGYDPNLPMKESLVSCGIYVRRGLLNVASAGGGDGIALNIGFDNSEAYAKWSNSKLNELNDMPFLAVDEGEGEFSKDVDYVYDRLQDLYATGRIGTVEPYPLAIFPVMVDKEAKTMLILNQIGDDGKLLRRTEIKQEIDNETTIVTVPTNYGITPFVKVWALLEIIFKNLGLEIERNDFKTDVELERLVVLNNVADSTCLGFIDYHDLMPDCTVQDFLHSLWCRFGLVYETDFTAGTVRLRVLRDILREDSSDDVFTDLASVPLVTYNRRQYIKLSAATSIEGAEPQTERFEDFARGCDLTTVKFGKDTPGWTWLPDRDKWDGDVRDDYFDDPNDPNEDERPDQPDPDYPDQPDPEPQPDQPDPWDSWDDDNYWASAGSEARPVGTGTPDTLAREFVTGVFYRLDSTNGKVKRSSSSFFNWDPMTEGADALELSSTDECVPIAAWGDSGQYGPNYLYGPRHLHSYINGSDEEESGETPLAFLLAYPGHGGTNGRLSPESDNGETYIGLSRTPGFTLYFQFRNGLFDRFWREYDEILRHGNRTIEFTAMLPLHRLLSIDKLRPVEIHGVRCLIDKMAYSLPVEGNLVAVDFTLRTINTQGDYDIKTEQNLPTFKTYKLNSNL